jgi:hypothetical protein
LPDAADEQVVAASRRSAELIAAMPFPTAQAMAMAAWVLSARAALSDRRPLDALPDERQAEWMDRWARARLAPLRQLVSGVRSIALTAFYAQEGAR